MKTTITTILLTFLSIFSFSQEQVNAYYDAVELQTHLKFVEAEGARVFENKNPSPAISLIRSYYPELDNLNDAEFAIKLTDEDDKDFYNPFLAEYLTAFVPTTNSGDTKNLPTTSKAATSILGTVTGIDVTTIAKGLSQFLIERANEEINVLFFDKFKEFMEKHEEIGILFPRSKDFIINTQPYQYAVMLPTFKEAFKKDIAEIVNQFDDLLQLDKYQQYGKDHPEVFAGLAALASVGQLMNGGNIQDVIKSLGSFENPSSTEAKNLYASIKLMYVLSESIRSKNDGEGWVSTADIYNNLVKGGSEANKERLKIYFGLLYKLTDQIEFIVKDRSKPGQNATKTIKMTEILSDAQDKLGDLKKIYTYFQSLEKKWDIIRLAKDEIDQKKDKGEEVPYTDYYAYFDKNLDLVETVLNVENLLKALNQEIKPVKYLDEGRQYLRALRTGNEIYKNVNEKSYISALMNAIVIYEVLVGKKIDIDFTTDEATMKAYLTAQGKKISSDLVDQFKKEILIKHKKDTTNFKKRYRKLKKEKSKSLFNGQFLTYASFMASIVEAEKAEDVKKILRAAALPAGSSSIKKYSKFNISVQSYLGLFYSFNPDDMIENAWSNRWGITAPVGFSVNTGLGRNGNGGALGFMVSVLDVGAIVDYELRNTTDPNNTMSTDMELEYKIELGQILSPGFYATYSFPKRIPLTLGIGTQYGPGLAQIEDNSGTANLVNRNPDWRFNVFLAFDIPIFTLVNTPK